LARRAFEAIGRLLPPLAVDVAGVGIGARLLEHLPLQDVVGFAEGLVMGQVSILALPAIVECEVRAELGDRPGFVEVTHRGALLFGVGRRGQCADRNSNYGELLHFGQPLVLFVQSAQGRRQGAHLEGATVLVMCGSGSALESNRRPVLRISVAEKGR
jgi:hypothetical protein